MINRKMTLEARIARLEKLLTNEGGYSERGHVNLGKGVAHTMEQNHDVRGATMNAEVNAERFEKATGIRLRRDQDYPIINSPVYGWTDSLDDLDADDDAFFVFKYDAVDDDSVSVYTCPTLNKFCVWVDEGAVNPKTGVADWEDDIYEALYPLDAWRGFSLDMISNESCRRSRTGRLTRNESSRKLRK